LIFINPATKISHDMNKVEFT